MLESGTYGSVRGALSNERPYRDPNNFLPLPRTLGFGREKRPQQRSAPDGAAGVFPWIKTYW
jgi:hypothetical protein